MKRKHRRILNKKGLTLVEVMVAIAILLMAAEIISLSVSFSARMNTRSQQLMRANSELGQKIQDESEGAAGTLRMNIGTATVSNKNADDGKLYTEVVGKEGSGFKINAVWTEDAVMTDLFKASGVEAPAIPGRETFHVLPGAFPNLTVRAAAGKITEVAAEDYCTSSGEGEDGSGGLIFHNDIDANAPSFVNLGSSVEITESGTYTAAGITVMELGNVSLLSDRISLWLGAEVYYLYGEIECQYSEKYKEKENMPIHMYLVPESGHKQPALVYVEESCKFIYTCVSEANGVVEDSKRVSYVVPAGWYAIPSGSGASGGDGANANDLLKLTSPADWKKYRLTDGNNNLEAGAVDQAYARLILAGIMDGSSDGNDETEDSGGTGGA